LEGTPGKFKQKGDDVGVGDGDFEGNRGLRVRRYMRASSNKRRGPRPRFQLTGKNTEKSLKRLRGT